MDKKIIHIGYHKTATTWFQNNYYPFVKNKEYVPIPIMWKTILGYHGLNFEHSFIKKYFDRNFDENFIICNENLSGNILTGGHHGFLTQGVCKRLKEVFEDAHIVIFIRNQRDIIASTYKEYVRAGGNYGYKRFLFHEDYPHPHRMPLFSFDHFNYYNIVKTYEKEFGKDNVSVFLFEEFVKNKEKFLTDYSNKFSFKINLKDVNLEPQRKGYGKFTLNFAKLLHCFTNRNVTYKYYIFNIPYWYYASKRLLNKLVFLDSPFKKLSPNSLFDVETIKFIDNYYRQSNRLLSKKCNLPLDQYGYPV